MHLPLWLPAEVTRTAWDVDTTRARALGLPSRPLAESIGDTWAWQSGHERPPMPERVHLKEPGLPADLEAKLLGSR